MTDHGIATNAEEAEGANAAPTALKDDDAAGSQDMSQVLPPAVSVSQVCSSYLGSYACMSRFVLLCELLCMVCAQTVLL